MEAKTMPANFETSREWLTEMRELHSRYTITVTKLIEKTDRVEVRITARSITVAVFETASSVGVMLLGMRNLLDSIQKFEDANRALSITLGQQEKTLESMKAEYAVVKKARSEAQEALFHKVEQLTLMSKDYAAINEERHSLRMKVAELEQKLASEGEAVKLARLEKANADLKRMWSDELKKRESVNAERNRIEVERDNSRNLASDLRKLSEAQAETIKTLQTKLEEQEQGQEQAGLVERLVKALEPFADLLEEPDKDRTKPVSVYVYDADVLAAKEALAAAKPSEQAARPNEDEEVQRVLKLIVDTTGPMPAEMWAESSEQKYSIWDLLYNPAREGRNEPDAEKRMQTLRQLFSILCQMPRRLVNNMVGWDNRQLDVEKLREEVARVVTWK
jgi:myosin heavy subunit